MRRILTFMALTVSALFLTTDVMAQRAIRPNRMARQQLNQYIYYEKNDTIQLNNDKGEVVNTTLYYRLTRNQLMRQHGEHFDTIAVSGKVCDKVKRMVAHTDLYLIEPRYRTRRAQHKENDGMWYLQIDCGKLHSYVCKGDENFICDDEERMEGYAANRKHIREINEYLDSLFKKEND
ncbi:MAG: hypothetical protein II562_00065 [Prevotella sp.]|nr:hypothetical protein [Prevotella sp.]